MIKEKHTHKLKRLRYKSGNVIFFCTLPDCKFKSSVPLLLGKRNICWRCGEEFLMTDYALRLAKPHCDDCHHSKSDSEEPLVSQDHVHMITDVTLEEFHLEQVTKEEDDEL